MLLVPCYKYETPALFYCRLIGVVIFHTESTEFLPTVQSCFHFASTEALPFLVCSCLIPNVIIRYRHQ